MYKGSSITGSSIATLFFVAVFNFFLFRVLPADPVKQLTRNHAVSPEQISAIRKQLGLDQALPRQFLTYLGALLHGDLGIMPSWTASPMICARRR